MRQMGAKTCLEVDVGELGTQVRHSIGGLRWLTPRGTSCISIKVTVVISRKKKKRKKEKTKGTWLPASCIWMGSVCHCLTGGGLGGLGRKEGEEKGGKKNGGITGKLFPAGNPNQKELSYDFPRVPESGFPNNNPAAPGPPGLLLPQFPVFPFAPHPEGKKKKKKRLENFSFLISNKQVHDMNSAHTRSKVDQKSSQRLVSRGLHLIKGEWRSMGRLREVPRKCPLKTNGDLFHKME